MATIEDIHKEKLHLILNSMYQFKKSHRGEDLYTATDKQNHKLKVQFNGYHFTIAVDSRNVKSVPIGMLEMENVKDYLEARLEADYKKVCSIDLMIDTKKV